MNEKTINDNPKITDKIVFDFETPNANGSLSSNPYELSKIVIYFVSRDYVNENLQKYEVYEESKKINDFYFREAEPIHTVGDENYPAWLSTDVDNALVENLDTCKFRYFWEPKGAREGDYFICWTWKPLAAGDVISKHLRFYLEGSTQETTSLPSHYTNPKKYETLLDRYLPEMFKMQIRDVDPTPDVLNRANKSIASGFKVLEDLANQLVDLQDANSLHEFLLPYLSNYLGLKLRTDDPTRWRGQIKRAVPIYKKKGTKSGLSEALDHIGVKLNKLTHLWQVVSSKTWQQSFEFDGQNKIFILEKTPVLPMDEINFEVWIRHKEDIEWTKLSYQYVSIFPDEDGIYKFIWIADNASFPEVYGLPSVYLSKGDEIRILYKYSEINSLNEQNLEDYIRSLPLMDTRETKLKIKAKTKIGSDIIFGLPINSEFKIGQKIYCSEFSDLVEVIEIVNFSSIKVSLQAINTNNNTFIVFKNFEYPPKNWNVRVLREDDPAFNVIIPERNPFFDPLVFGKVRTEFPYSENIYHMEEYNGSIRDSKNPCDIDKSFVDPCYACISSSYDLDVEVENLSDDKVVETKNVIIENTPLHAVMHTCNFIGGINEFIESPQENLEILTTYSGSDFIVAGQAQSYFFRIMLDFQTKGLERTDLADVESVLVGSGVCFNEEILIYCPDVVLSNAGVAPNGDSFIQIKSPSLLSGDYAVSISQSNTLKIIDPSSLEPINQIDSPFDDGTEGIQLSSSAFTFDLNNIVYPINGSLCNIIQDNIFTLRDDNYDFNFGTDKEQIKTLRDVENGNASYAWEIELSYGTFQIKDIINGSLLLLNHDSLLPTLNTTNETWSLKKNEEVVTTSAGGKIFVEKRGRVISLDSSFHPISKILTADNYYQLVDGTEYHVSNVKEQDEYYLINYDQGSKNGIIINMRQKIVKEKIGYLSYRGMKLNSSEPLNVLGIQSENDLVNNNSFLLDNNSFKENFIVKINNNYSYWIHDINNDEITLSGSAQYFKTSGTNVNFEIFKYNKKGATIIGQKTYLPQHTFPTIDRDGRAVITSDILEGNTSTVTGLSDNGKVEDFVNQQEEVSFKIEYKNKEGEGNE